MNTKWALVPVEATGDTLDAMLKPWLREGGSERECLTAGWAGALAVNAEGAALLAEVLAARDAYNADEDIESLFALLAALDKLGPAAEGAA